MYKRSQMQEMSIGLYVREGIGRVQPIDSQESRVTQVREPELIDSVLAPIPRSDHAPYCHLLCEAIQQKGNQVLRGVGFYKLLTPLNSTRTATYRTH